MPTDLKYKRILLKLSGEQLGNRIETVNGETMHVGFDTKKAEWIATEVKKLTDIGVQVVITVGGGNFLRGADVSGDLIHHSVADSVGILMTNANAILLGEVFNRLHLPVRATSKVSINEFIDDYSHRRTEHDIINKRRAVIIGGGSGATGFSSDMGAANAASEHDCDVIIKATKVDGVYNKDPKKYPDAVKFDRLDYETATFTEDIKVLDKPSMAMAWEHSIPIVVCELKEDNILRVVKGEAIGTIIN
jgi:Uridylate kinase